MRLAHIINPVRVSPASDLYAAQPVTFESMRRARSAVEHELEVDLLACFYPEDAAVAPADFCPTPPLDRSILDLGVFRKGRKLPLVADILERLYRASDADSFIFTNVDIGLQPHFYREVASLIRQGHQAFVINRRTIPKEPSGLEALPQMLAHPGEPHPGHDCFVWPRKLQEHWVLENLCVGTIGIGKGIILNQIASAERFTEFTDLHLTFHLGADRAWNDPELADVRAFNLAELRKIVNRFRDDPKVINHPLCMRFIRNLGLR